MERPQKKDNYDREDSSCPGRYAGLLLTKQFVEEIEQQYPAELIDKAVRICLAANRRDAAYFRAVITKLAL